MKKWAIPVTAALMLAYPGIVSADGDHGTPNLTVPGSAAEHNMTQAEHDKMMSEGGHTSGTDTHSAGTDSHTSTTSGHEGHASGTDSQTAGTDSHGSAGTDSHTSTTSGHEGHTSGTDSHTTGTDSHGSAGGGHGHGVVKPETPPNFKVLGTFGAINAGFILVGIWNKLMRRKGI